MIFYYKKSITNNCPLCHYDDTELGYTLSCLFKQLHGDKESNQYVKAKLLIMLP